MTRDGVNDCRADRDDVSTEIVKSIKRSVSSLLLCKRVSNLVALESAKARCIATYRLRFRHVGAIVMRRPIIAIAAIAVFVGINFESAANAGSAIGINLTSAEYLYSTFPTSSNLDYIQNQNITLIRLPIAWERIQPTFNGLLDSSYIAGLKSFLNDAAAHGMQVIVDLHNFGRYDPNYFQDSSLGLLSNGFASTPLTLPSSGSYTIEVTAKGSPAGGVWPTMKIMVDGAFVGSTSVSSATLASYDFPITVAAGTHTISVGFTNDAYFGGEDRNLYLHDVKVTGPSSFRTDLLAINMPDRPISSVMLPSPGPGNIIGSVALPVSAFADLWSKLATALNEHAGLSGYDIMNEPHGMGSTTIWPLAAQAAVNAIRSVDMNTTIYVEGDNWSNASTWATVNANLHIVDPTNNLVYEAHQYFDSDQSSNYALTYDQQGAYPNIGVDRVEPFLQWLQQNNAKGFIGEFGVPGNDPRWITVLDNFLNAIQAAGVSGTYWYFLTHKPGDPSWWLTSGAMNAAPLASGQISPQMQLIASYQTPINQGSTTTSVSTPK